MNREIANNYLPSFALNSEQVLTFKTYSVWSQKKYETSRLSFMVCFKGIRLSQSIHQPSCSLIMCSSVSQTGDDCLRVCNHSVFTDWTSLKRRRLHRTGITEPLSSASLSLFRSITQSHLTDWTSVPTAEIKYKRKKLINNVSGENGESYLIKTWKRDAKEKEVLNTETGEYIQLNYRWPNGHY